MPKKNAKKMQWQNALKSCLHTPGKLPFLDGSFKWRNPFLKKRSKIRAYDSSSCFAGKLPSLTLMNAENVLPNSLSDGFAVAKRHAIMAHDWGFPNLIKKTNSNDGPGSYQLFRFWLFLLPYAWENVTYKNTTEKRLKKSNLQNCKKMRLKKCEFQKCKKMRKKCV